MIRIQARGPNEAEILIHEPIGENWFGDGLTSRRFARELKELGDVSKIVVRINSPGGAVHDGIAIYNALRNHGAHIEVRVEGLAASIASIVAMAGDEIIMGVGSMMMIHAPWTIALGNAAEMREVADMLEKHEQALAEIYVKRGAAPDDVKEMMSGETWLTATEAVEHGLADVAESEEEEAAAELRKKHREVFERFLTDFRDRTANLSPIKIAAALRAEPGEFRGGGSERRLEEVLKRHNAELLEQIQSFIQSAVADATQKEAEMPKKDDAPASVQTTDKQNAPDQAGNDTASVDAEKLKAAVRAEERERREKIREAFGSFAAEYRELLDKCLDDPEITVEVARTKLLNELGKRHQPLAGPVSVQLGADERDKQREAAVNAILARIGSSVYDPNGKNDKLPRVDNSNPYRGFSLFDLAEDAVKRMGMSTRGMNRSMIVAAAFGHTTSDFPTLLENAMHKLLLVAYQGAEVTWPRVVRIGDLSDFRAHPRYRFGTFSDIKEVNETGRYEQGTISDAEKESITAKRKGRILVVTRELVVNDDLQALSDAARGMGRAASRTIDKDLYALLALNTGNGPTMGDGNPLFHSDHKNIASTPGAPSVTLVDAARVQMAQQTDPSGNDYVGIRPAIAWCPLALGSAMRVLNDSQYDPDANNKLQRPNSVRGLFRDVVDSPRLDALSSTAWYVLADPAEEPVFEVGFLGGVREPRVEQDQEFSSDALQWKVVHEYGVAAIGWRGIVKNAGSGG